MVDFEELPNIRMERSNTGGWISRTRRFYRIVQVEREIDYCAGPHTFCRHFIFVE